MLHQVEFLFEGNLLPMTIDEFRVSDRFLLEAVVSKNLSDKLSYAIGYFATEEEEHFFQPAINQVNFFLLLYSLISGQAVTFKTGIGTELKDLDSLGKKDSHFLIMKNFILWGLQRMAFGQDQFTKQKSCS
jgi:hypothetical protein